MMKAWSLSEINLAKGSSVFLKPHFDFRIDLHLHHCSIKVPHFNDLDHTSSLG